MRKELSLLVFGGETKKADDDMMPKIKVELLKKHSSLFHYGTMTDEKAYADVIGWLVKEGILKMDINQTAEGIELIWSIIDRGE